jgi:hypothetical protein
LYKPFFAQHSDAPSSIEAEMRATITALLALVALMSVSAQAGPLLPARSTTVELGAAPPIELVAQDCGPGWHRHHWRDRCAIGIGATASRIGDLATGIFAFSIMWVI